MSTKGYSVTFETFTSHCFVCAFRSPNASTPVCHDTFSVCVCVCLGVMEQRSFDVERNTCMCVCLGTFPLASSHSFVLSND